METKELKIVAPEGFEIDNENSTFEKIIFKKKYDGKPRTWEEYCKRGFTGKEGIAGVGYVDNIEEAEAFFALMQLRQLRKAWVSDWKSDWKDDNSTKYSICVYHEDIVVWHTRNVCFPLLFPTEEMAKEFLECFKDLLEKAKILL